jgi:hypothetical protein
MLPCRRLTIVFVHLGAVKIYATAVEALRRKNERQDETQFTTNNDGFIPRLVLMNFFAGFF